MLAEMYALALYNSREPHGAYQRLAPVLYTKIIPSGGTVVQRGSVWRTARSFCDAGHEAEVGTSFSHPEIGRGQFEDFGSR